MTCRRRQLYVGVRGVTVHEREMRARCVSFPSRFLFKTAQRSGTSPEPPSFSYWPAGISSPWSHPPPVRSGGPGTGLVPRVRGRFPLCNDGRLPNDRATIDLTMPLINDEAVPVGLAPPLDTTCVRNLVRAGLGVGRRRVATSTVVRDGLILRSFDLGIGRRRIAASAVVGHLAVLGRFDFPVAWDAVAPDAHLGEGRGADSDKGGGDNCRQ
jgi:hypothetical protein